MESPEIPKYAVEAWVARWRFSVLDGGQLVKVVAGHLTRRGSGPASLPRLKLALVVDQGCRRYYLGWTVLSIRQESVDQPDKLLGLLDLGAVAAVVQHRQSGAWNRLVIELGGAQGNNGVLPPPEDEGGQSL